VSPILREIEEVPMWTVRLTDKQLEALKSLLAEQDRLGPALSRSLESLQLARWDDLPEARLPWQDITQIASAQGVSEADVVWDLCGRRAKHQPKKARPEGKRTRRAASK
jgi:hypothetical protein